MFVTPMRSFVPALLLLCLSLPALVFAAPSYPQIVPSVPDVEVYGTVDMIPLTPMADLLGIKSSVDKVNGSTTVTMGIHTMVYTPKSTTATCDGAEIPLPMAPLLSESGLLYVPVKTFIEGLGGTLTVNTAHSLCQISMPTQAKPLTLPCIIHKDAKTAYYLAGLELYAVNLDGSALRRLTYDSYDNGLPVFVPNSTSFYYSHNGGIVKRTADDSTETPLPKPKDADPTVPLFPCGISADGKALLCEQVREYSLVGTIFLLYTDGTEPVTLTNEGYAPCMSPDGKTIACLHGKGEKMALYIMSADGTGRKCIEENASYTFHPRFSPDGALLAYQRDSKTDDGKPCPKIIIYRVTGENAGKSYELPSNEMKAREYNAAFSMDSKLIVISSFENGMRLMKPDRTEARKLVTYVTNNPVITPDGTQILYTAGSTLYSVSSDGTNNRELLKNIDIRDLTLSPDGKQLILLVKPSANITSVKHEEW